MYFLSSTLPMSNSNAPMLIMKTFVPPCIKICFSFMYLLPTELIGSIFALGDLIRLQRYSYKYPQHAWIYQAVLICLELFRRFSIIRLLGACLFLVTPTLNAFHLLLLFWACKWTYSLTALLYFQGSSWADMSWPVRIYLVNYKPCVNTRSAIIRRPFLHSEDLLHRQWGGHNLPLWAWKGEYFAPWEHAVG